jgi:hypothetical protein
VDEIIKLPISYVGQPIIGEGAISTVIAFPQNPENIVVKTIDRYFAREFIELQKIISKLPPDIRVPEIYYIQPSLTNKTNVYVERINGYEFHKSFESDKKQETYEGFEKECEILSEISVNEWKIFFSTIEKLPSYDLELDFGSPTNFIVDHDKKIWFIDLDYKNPQNQYQNSHDSEPDIENIINLIIISKDLLTKIKQDVSNSVWQNIENHLITTINKISAATGIDLSNIKNYIKHIVKYNYI